MFLFHQSMLSGGNTKWSRADGITLMPCSVSLVDLLTAMSVRVSFDWKPAESGPGVLVVS